jgi:hypothetical protein
MLSVGTIVMGVGALHRAVAFRMQTLNCSVSASNPARVIRVESKWPVEREERDVVGRIGIAHELRQDPIASVVR